MGRRTYGNIFTAMAREAERQRRIALAEEKQIERAAEKARKEAARNALLREKEKRQLYLQSRIDEVEELNNELRETLDGFSKILNYGLSVNSVISFESLKINEECPKFSPPKELLTPIIEPKHEHFIDSIKKPGIVEKLIPGWKKRYEQAIKQAADDFRHANNKFNEVVEKRKNENIKYQEQYEIEKNAWELKVQKRSTEVDDFEQAYRNKDIASVVTYNSMVLERSQYPAQFPQNFRITYNDDSKQLLIEYQLPTLDIVPEAQEYKYIKSRDAIENKLRKKNDIKVIYQDVISSICLRTIHEVFEADQGSVIDLVVLNGYVDTVDPATGKSISPFLISIRVTKEVFNEIDLNRVEYSACLRNLGAQVSPRPDEIQPIKPIMEFNMVDKRFVDQRNILSELDSKQNLMDLNPFEFENLVGDLFNKLGLETRQTRSSKDGGVDVVAYDLRAVLGGKVVIQAKRYKNPVGVSAVRDLYGTMMNEGANKGILVTTSHYGTEAYNFSKDKPIELIDGGGLLHLLDEVGYSMTIIIPKDC